MQQNFNEVCVWGDHLPTFATSALPYSSGQILSDKGKLSVLSNNKSEEIAYYNDHQVSNDTGTLIVLSELNLNHDEIDKALQHQTDNRIYLSEWMRK